MADTKIDLGDMTPLVQKAILDSLTDDVRTALIEKAIANLITPERNQYGSTPEPPIQAMFRSAMYSCAEQIVKQIITDSPVYREQVENIVQGFLTKMDQDSWDSTMMEVVTRAIVEHLKKKANR